MRIQAIATISKEGRIVIPKALREKYGLHPGMKIAIIDYGETLTLVPIPKDIVQTMRGYLPAEPSLIEELLAEHHLERLRGQKLGELIRE